MSQQIAVVALSLVPFYKNGMLQARDKTLCATDEVREVKSISDVSSDVFEMFFIFLFTARMPHL